MAEVTWFKVLTDIFGDDKIKILQSMPEGDSLLVMWFKVLSQAGKTNDGGYIYLKKNIPYTFGMFATLFGKQQQLVELAMRTFSEFGMIDIDDSGYVFVTNWEKHQSIDKLNQIKEKANVRLKKHRDKKRMELLENNVSATFQQLPSNAIDLELDLDLEKDNKQEEEEERKEENPTIQTAMDAYYFSFKKMHYTGHIQGYIVELSKRGFTDPFIREVFLAMGEYGASPDINYMKKLAEDWISKGIYTLTEAKRRRETEHLKIVPDRTKPTDKELESRNIEIARSRWIQEGNDPNAFRYHSPTSA